MFHILGSSNCRTGGMSAALPIGAPVSIHFTTLAISSSFSEMSFLYC